MIEYDVAISFAGEDRALAHSLANELYFKYGLIVFYDDYEQAKLIGKNLTEYLVDIYKNKASYCVILISKHYREKRWTRHEWRAAQARAFEEPDSDYILPVRIDETDLPGLLPTTGYISISEHGVEKVSKLIYEKVSDVANHHKAIREARELYSKGEFRKALYSVRDPVFDNDINALRIRADIYGKFGEYEKSIECLLKIRDERENDFLANFLLGIFYFRVLDFESSIRYFEVADDISPNHPTIATDLPAARMWKKISVIPILGRMFLLRLQRSLEKQRIKLLKKA
jgi:tetratricopeptide (TPR) repeat protein